jgi:hypothetical protein
MSCIPRCSFIDHFLCQSQVRHELPQCSGHISGVSGSRGKHVFYTRDFLAVASLPQNFDIFLDVNDRFLVSINPPMSTEVSATGEQQPQDNTARLWALLSVLCQKVHSRLQSSMLFFMFWLQVLRSANRVLHSRLLSSQ